MESFKKKLISFLKIIFVMLPIVWILTKINFHELAVKFGMVPVWVVPVFTSILVFRVWLQSYRFQYLSRLYTKTLRVGKLFWLDMKARYYSMVIPSSVGQDIIRGTMLKEHLTTDQVVSVSLFFRITGVLPFLILSFFGFIQLSSRPEFHQFTPMLVGSTIFFVVGLFALFSRRASSRLGKLVPSRLPQKYRKFMKDVVVSFQLYRTAPSLMIHNFINSCITQFLVVVLAVILIYGITNEWYFVETLTFIPLIELMAILVPFAPNGAGVREIMSILLFTTLNRSHEEMLVYLAINSIGHFVNLSGIFVVIYDKIYITKRNKK